MRNSRVFTPLSTVQPPRCAAPPFPSPSPRPSRLPLPERPAVSKTAGDSEFDQRELARSENTRPGPNVSERNGRKEGSRTRSAHRSIHRQRVKRGRNEPLGAWSGGGLGNQQGSQIPDRNIMPTIHLATLIFTKRNRPQMQLIYI